MSLTQHLLEQLDSEHDSTRRVLERIPASMMDWRPHEKSMTTHDLANHVANLISWGAMILTTDELDFASEEMQNWKPPVADTPEGIVEILDQNVSQVKGIVEGMSDADLEKIWTMRSGDQVFAADSRLFAFTKWVLSHQSHHRAQLMVYLRMNDVPVPGIFGPSADEQGM